MSDHSSSPFSVWSDSWGAALGFLSAALYGWLWDTFATDDPINRMLPLLLVAPVIGSTWTMLTESARRTSFFQAIMSWVVAGILIMVLLATPMVQTAAGWVIFTALMMPLWILIGAGEYRDRERAKHVHTTAMPRRASGPFRYAALFTLMLWFLGFLSMDVIDDGSVGPWTAVGIGGGMLHAGVVYLTVRLARGRVAMYW